jgi:NADP-dependent 3-hydroxy acid dehydrogenase YdfG
MKKVISIVGMGPGISYAVALKFGHAGYHVAMISRNSEKLKAYQEMLEEDGLSLSYYPADVTNEAQLGEVFEQIRLEYGDTQVLFYNAARVAPHHPLETSGIELVQDFKTNILGAITATRLVLPPMQEQNLGTLLYTGGGLALKPMIKMGSLAIGKAGLRNFVLQMAQELASSHIKVGTVTVNGFVTEEDPKYNPSAIADEFWKIHQEHPSQPEVVY